MFAAAAWVQAVYMTFYTTYNLHLCCSAVFMTLLTGVHILTLQLPCFPAPEEVIKNSITVIPRPTNIIHSGITFVSRNHC